MVTRRVRWKTVCARGAWVALVGGPSTSPLGASDAQHSRVHGCRRRNAGAFAQIFVDHQAQTPSVCELAAHGKDYDRHWVAVEARLKVETRTLHDPKCPNAGILVELVKNPDPALCAQDDKPLGCANDYREFIDGMFLGVFHAASATAGARLEFRSRVNAITPTAR